MRRLIISILCGLTLMAWGTAFATSPNVYGAHTDGGCYGDDSHDDTACLGTAGVNALAAHKRLNLENLTYHITTTGGVNGTNNRWSGLFVDGNGTSNLDCDNGSACLDLTGSNGVTLQGFGYIRNGSSPSKAAILIGRQNLGGSTGCSVGAGLITIRNSGIGFYTKNVGDYGIVDEGSEQNSYYDSWWEVDQPYWVAGYTASAVTPPVTSSYVTSCTTGYSHLQTTFHNMTLMAGNSASIDINGLVGMFNLDNTYLSAKGYATAPSNYGVRMESGATLSDSHWNGEIEGHPSCLNAAVSGSTGAGIYYDTFNMQNAANNTTTPIFNLTDSFVMGSEFDGHVVTGGAQVLGGTGSTFYGNVFNLNSETITVDATGQVFPWYDPTVHTGTLISTGNIVKGNYYTIN